MKKSFVFIASAIVAMGVSFHSCNNAPSEKVALNNEVDSLSYSFGASIAENLSNNFQQAGIIVDTFNVSMEYSAKMQGETDEVKKASLQKEMRHKIDSLNKANEYGIVEFLRGFKAGMDARASESNYNLGLSFGNQIAQQGIPNVTSQFYPDEKDKELNKNAITAAVVAVVQKKALMFPSASSYIMMKSQESQQKMMMKQSQAGEVNKVIGEKFLEENKSKEGVVTLPSGLQYKILTAGKGPKPKITDKVECHYHGQLLDGTVFDSSVERGTPASFPVQGVIPGWIEILQLMPVGSKWEVYIPYDLAYGEQGTGGEIAPYSTLTFQIELLSILPSN